MEALDFSHDLQQLGEMLVEEYREVLKQEGINATDQLSQTAAVKVEQESTYWELSLLLQDYWKYVEFGRKPGKWPPRDAIEKWIEAKPVIPTPDANGRIPTTRSLAYLIARKIGQRGTEARHALKTARNDAWIQQVRDMIAARLLDQEMYMVGQFTIKP